VNRVEIRELFVAAVMEYRDLGPSKAVRRFLAGIGWSASTIAAATRDLSAVLARCSRDGVTDSAAISDVVADWVLDRVSA